MPWRKAERYYRSKRAVVAERAEPVRRLTLDPIREHVRQVLAQ